MNLSEALLPEDGLADIAIVNKNQEAEDLFEDARIACARAAVLTAGGETRSGRTLVEQAAQLLHARAIYLASGLAIQRVSQ